MCIRLCASAVSMPLYMPVLHVFLQVCVHMHACISLCVCVCLCGSVCSPVNGSQDGECTVGVYALYLLFSYVIMRERYPPTTTHTKHKNIMQISCLLYDLSFP